MILKIALTVVLPLLTGFAALHTAVMFESYALLAVGMLLALVGTLLALHQVQPHGLPPA